MAYITHSTITRSAPAASVGNTRWSDDFWHRMALPLIVTGILFKMVANPERYSLDDDI